MRRIVVLCGVALLVISGCRSTKTEFSAEQHEGAVVISTVHTPSRHDVGLGITAYEGLYGESRDLNGNPGLDLGNGLQISSSTVPEKFAVVFECQHGRFIIERKAIFDRFNGLERRTVDVAYRTKYQVTYDEVDGEKREIERVIVDYDFLDAVLARTP